jgi:YidC/Oxa1 family membrane protein insertase
MDKRFFLALVLTAIVIVGTPFLFPNAKRPPVRAVDSVQVHATRADSAAPATTGSAASGNQTAATTPIAAPAIARASNDTVSGSSSAAGTVRPETTVVNTRLARYAFSSRGAAPISIVLDSYPSRRPAARGRAAELVRSNAPLVGYRFAVGGDTIVLDRTPLSVRRTATPSGAPVLAYAGRAAGHGVQLAYTFVPDSFLVHVAATVAGAPEKGTLLIDLPRGLQSNEADTLDDINHLGVSYRTSRGDVTSVGFSKLDTGEVRVEPGPLDWVATRDKYFLVALRTPPKQPFGALRLAGEPRTGKSARDIAATVALPLKAGAASFELYAGPQDFARLQKLGDDLDQVNPYGGWIHGAVQPFVTIVMRALLWMKHTTNLSYGWVLVLFGVLIRLALWPLNQRAMRTSIAMQRLQPELQAIQKKHKEDPRRQQEVIMKVYKEHGMSPLSPLMGCLPMLLPMPVLYALYFVFQNTIEFRGVPFLWLPDLSMRDPYYITPLVMGLSMYVMSWIGLKAAPPNPQAKVMSYMMPVMLTVLFLNLASGLNLYYAVQNIAALPQQWLLARERQKAGPVAVVSAPAAAPAVKRRS